MKNVRKTTIRDVAELADVSISTVSKALRGVGYVSEATRAKVDDAVLALGYRIDKNASNLRSQQSHVIGVVLNNHIGANGQRHPFLSDMILAITHQVVEHGYDVLFLEQTTRDDWYGEKKWYTDVAAGRVDGLILLGGSTDHQRYLQRIGELNARQVPFVEWMGADSPGSTHCGIGIDGRRAAYNAVSHLIKLGRRKIAFIGLEDSQLNSEMDQRRSGYLDAMREMEHIDADMLSELQALIQFSSTEDITSFDSAQRITQELLNRDVGFDAVFALTDLMAMAAINTLRHNGLDVPKDIAIVGFDNISAAGYFNPPLTTVSQGVLKGGGLLVDRLIDLLNGIPVDSILLPSRLVVRESCGAGLSRQELH